MKNFAVILLVLSCSFGFGQSLTKTDYRNSQERWILSVGVNALGNEGTRNPVERLDEFSLKNPLAFAIEYRWSDFLAIEQDFSFNGYNANTRIDNGLLTEDIFYFSTNTNVKYYYSDYLFDANWLDLYVSGGLGVFSIKELNTSANLSVGALFWLNDTRTIGVRFQTTGKFAFKHKSNQFDNNHWQHFLQAVFRL
nr:hypothetical protein [uncultured Psychroserpens sp.]